MRLRVFCLAASVFALAPAFSQTRVTAADYQRAEKFMTYNTASLVVRSGVRPNWLPGDRFWRTVRPVAEPAFRGLLRLSVTGAEHVPQSGPVVFVANHQSLWDIPAIGSAQPRAAK